MNITVNEKRDEMRNCVYENTPACIMRDISVLKVLGFGSVTKQIMAGFWGNDRRCWYKLGPNVSPGKFVSSAILPERIPGKHWRSGIENAKQILTQTVHPPNRIMRNKRKTGEKVGGKRTLEDRVLKLRENREVEEEEEEERDDGDRTTSFLGMSGERGKEGTEWEESLRESDFFNLFQEPAIDGEREKGPACCRETRVERILFNKGLIRVRVWNGHGYDSREETDREAKRLRAEGEAGSGRWELGDIYVLIL